MNKKLIKSRTCTYNINYHIVWSVKYRNKVLTQEIATSLKEIAREVAIEKDFIIHCIEVGECDHVHIFISAHPKYSISYIVKMLKGITGRKLFIAYPKLKQSLRKGVLWNHSYYVETIGSTAEENIKQYIEKQQTSY